MRVTRARALEQPLETATVAALADITSPHLAPPLITPRPAALGVGSVRPPTRRRAPGRRDRSASEARVGRRRAVDRGPDASPARLCRRLGVAAELAATTRAPSGVGRRGSPTPPTPSSPSARDDPRCPRDLRAHRAFASRCALRRPVGLQPGNGDASDPLLRRDPRAPARDRGAHEGRDRRLSGESLESALLATTRRRVRRRGGAAWGGPSGGARGPWRAPSCTPWGRPGRRRGRAPPSVTICSSSASRFADAAADDGAAVRARVEDDGEGQPRVG